MTHIPGHTLSQELQEALLGTSTPKTSQQLEDALRSTTTPQTSQQLQDALLGTQTSQLEQTPIERADEVIQRQGAAPPGIGLDQNPPIFKQIQPSDEGGLLRRIGGQILDRGVLAPIGGGSLSKTLEGAEILARPFQAGAEALTGVIGLEKALLEKAGVSSGVTGKAFPLSSDIFLRPETFDQGVQDIFKELVEENEARPFYQELILGLATDPTVIIPGKLLGNLVTKLGLAGRSGNRVAIQTARAELVQAIRGVADERAAQLGERVSARGINVPVSPISPQQGPGEFFSGRPRITGAALSPESVTVRPIPGSGNPIARPVGPIPQPVRALPQASGRNIEGVIELPGRTQAERFINQPRPIGATIGPQDIRPVQASPTIPPGVGSEVVGRTVPGVPAGTTVSTPEEAARLRELTQAAGPDAGEALPFASRGLSERPPALKRFTAQRVVSPQYARGEISPRLLDRSGPTSATVGPEGIRAAKVDVPPGRPPRNVPIEETPSISVPVNGPTTVIPSQNSSSLYGLKPVETGLGDFAKVKNAFRETITGRTGIPTTIENEIARPLINDRRRVKTIIKSVSNEASQRAKAILDEGGMRGCL